MQHSRRSFMRAAGVIAGGAAAARYLPAILEAQGMTLEAMRAQLGAAPIETAKLGERLVMLSGPGGNVLVLHGSTGKILVDGFVQPAYDRLTQALDAIDGTPVKSLIDTHWHFDHSDNNANFHRAGAG